MCRKNTEFGRDSLSVAMRFSDSLVTRIWNSMRLIYCPTSNIG